MDRIDIRKNDNLIDAINSILNNKEICEVKVEHTGITVVAIHRTLKLKEQIE